MGSWIEFPGIAAALGCGLTAGFFFAFSVVIMRALERLPPEQGIAAMQHINVVVLNAWFLTAFFGTAVLCIGLAVWTLSHLAASGAIALLAGAILYLAGVIIVTIAFNVPLNNALARVDPGSAEGARLWHRYLSDWTRWNHVRTVCPLAAAALIVLALTQL